MEQNNFSYAKRKVIAMPTILIITIVIFIFVILTQQVSAAGYVWGQTYIYDNIDDSYLNQSLWTNVTSCIGACGGINAFANITEDSNSINGIANAYHFGGSLATTAYARLTSGAGGNYLPMPLTEDINNITFSAYIYANSPSGAGADTISSISIFGTTIKSLHCDGSVICSLSDTTVWMLSKNETNGINRFDVFNDGVYQQTILATNSPLTIISQAYMLTSFPSSAGFSLYYVNYSLSDKTLNITLDAPINNYYHYSISSPPTTNITFNVSIETSVNTLKNLTFYTDSVVRYNQEITGITNTSNYENNFTIGNHNWYVYVCDSADNCKFSDIYLFTESTFVTVSTNYSATAYETESQTFNVTVTYDTVAYPNAYAYIVYNGVSDTVNSVKTISGNNTMFSSTIDIPASTGVKDFYFIIYFDPANPTNYQLTTINNQTVSAINFSICGSAGGTVPFINMNYLDENTLAPVNLSVMSSTWKYWLGGGSTYKNYFYNSVGLNTSTNHTFCFIPASVPSTYLYTNIAYQYGLTGVYPTRTFYTTTPPYLTLTNTTTDVNLYTLSFIDSGSITIQVVDSTSANVISGAEVRIQRNIGGSLITIFNGLTDSAGLVNVYLSTTSPYTITASKTGCGINTQTVTPVGSYNMQLNCASSAPLFNSTIQGIAYQRGPADGVNTQIGWLTYDYLVTSSTRPIYQAKFVLKDAQKNILATNETNVSSGYSYCNSTSCLLSIRYYTVSGDDIKGSYYVNLGNAANNTGYILLEGDAHWRFIVINSNNSNSGVTRFADNFNEFFLQWEADGNCRDYHNQPDCTSSGFCKWVNQTGYVMTPELCILKDDYNKAEFSRIIFIFFGMVTVLFIIGKTTGYEMTNPGSFVMFMSGSIIIMSMLGFFRFNGATPNPWLDQYIYAIICTMFSIGYNISIVRRYSA